MPEVPDPSVNPLTPAQSQSPEPPAGSAEGGSAPLRAPVVNGQRWQEYQIGEALDTDVGWCFLAVNVGTLEEVTIRIFPSTGPGGVREQTWNELKSLNRRDVLVGIAAIEEGGFRYEIWHPSPVTTLRDWAAARQASLEDIQTLVQQIGDILVELHDRGIAHLNLHPDTIYLPNEDTALKIQLGGFEHATIYNQAELIPVPVNPLYAPPEAAGLTKHSPGAGLRAWDWWSLGRVLQELVLGRHVLGVVLNREMSRGSAETKGKAESLLLERDPNAPRAGAVELMPPMSQRLTDLLRGLLTSSRDGRWGADEIQRWLKQQPVKDRYQLARNEQLFAWKDRMYTVSEAAELFASEENWSDGVANFFEFDNPTSLAYFVADRPEYRQIKERIEELHRFMQIPNWAELPLEARQTAVLAAGWLLIGGEDAKLLIFGQRADANCVKNLFARGIAEGVATVKAMTARPYIELISSNDPDAARLFTTLSGTVASDAVMRAINQGWLNLSNPADYARLLLLAMESERKLFETRADLQARFACSREAHIQQLLTQPKLTHSELVLLASTAAQPERYGYVTHEEWKRSRYDALRERGAKLSTALFWLRLGLALKVGYVVFGPIYLVAAGWIGAGILAGWPHGLANLYLWAGGALGIFLTLRLLGGIWVDLMVRRRAAGTKAWTLFTRLGRCADEAKAIMAETEPVSGRALGNELARIRGDIGQLGLKPPPPALPLPGFALPAWGTSFASWILLVAGILAGHLNREELLVKSPSDGRTTAARVIENAMKPAAPDEKPSAEDFFFDDPRNPRSRWNVQKPASVPMASIGQVKPATSDDVARALIDGQKLLLSYRHDSVDSLIAVPVTGKNGAGLMLYDGHNRRVIERKLLVPNQDIGEKSWFDLESLKVFYPGRLPETAPTAKPVPEVPAAGDPADLPEREIRRGRYQETSAGADEKTTKAQPLPEALDTMLP